MRGTNALMPSPTRAWIQCAKEKRNTDRGWWVKRTMTWGDVFQFLSQHPVLFIGGLIFVIAARMSLYAKAGKPAWAALIPFYAEWTFAKIVGAPGVMGLLLWVPLINFMVWFAFNFGLARKFGKSPLYALGLCFFNPIFMPMLAFGSARYRLSA